MAKAQITTPEGVSIKVEGTPDEIVNLIAELKKRDGTRTATGRSRSKLPRSSVTALVESLIDGGFFKKPRGLAEVKDALAEMGHHYPVTTLSGVMLKQVRRRNLRRLKTNKVWTYAR
jgi:hypothetical protein